MLWTSPAYAIYDTKVRSEDVRGLQVMISLAYAIYDTKVRSEDVRGLQLMLYDT
jgi:hypothetical protein